MIKQLEWDSENFQLKIGEYICPDDNSFDFNLVNSYAKDNGFDLVYIKSNSPIAVLDDSNIFCDQRVVYSKNVLNRNMPVINNKQILSYKNGPLSEDIINLAINSGQFSRFNLDPKFSVNAFRTLYYNWIYNSINTDFAKDVLVYHDHDYPIGILTYDISSDVSTIGIIAVNEKYRGQHVGSSLLDYYYSVLPESIKKLRVVTQGINITACKFYERNGYTVEEISYTYHLWVN